MNAYVAAMRPSVMVGVAALVLACASCFPVIGRPGAQPGEVGAGLEDRAA